jgi:hypothetical protein
VPCWCVRACLWLQYLLTGISWLVPLDTVLDRPNFCPSLWAEDRKPYFIRENPFCVICSLPLWWGMEYDARYEDWAVVMSQLNIQHCLFNTITVVARLRVVSECQPWSCGIACTVSGWSRTHISPFRIPCLDSNQVAWSPILIVSTWTVFILPAWLFFYIYWRLRPML